MPNQPKAWVSFPGTSTPCDAPALVGLEGRVANYVGAQEIGTGVGGYEDFRVKQSGGGNMSVDVGLAATLMRSFLPGDANGGTNRLEYSGVQLNALVPAANVTNPRIDIVTLAPPSSIDSQVPQPIVVAGTATAGATLQNRNGAPALPAGRIHLADLLVPANATQILTAQIQDQRGYPFAGVTPPVFTLADLVQLESVAGIPQITTGVTPTQAGGAAMLVWLSRRVVANRIRWRYRQGATAATSNYQWSIFSAAGRILATSASTAFSGAANAGVTANNPLTFTGSAQLEAGAYWIAFQLPSAVGASASVTYLGYQGGQVSASSPGVAMPNVYAQSASSVFAGVNPLWAIAVDSYAQTTDTAGVVPIPACSIGA